LGAGRGLRGVCGVGRSTAFVHAVRSAAKGQRSNAPAAAGARSNDATFRGGRRGAAAAPCAVGVEPLVEQREARVEQRAALGEEDLGVSFVCFEGRLVYRPAWQWLCGECQAC
jgi:hypothetical protein